MEMPGLTLGPPVVYVPVYPADHLGGPRGYVRRPEGDKTQYLVAESTAGNPNANSPPTACVKACCSSQGEKL